MPANYAGEASDKALHEVVGNPRPDRISLTHPQPFAFQPAIVLIPHRRCITGLRGVARTRPDRSTGHPQGSSPAR